VLTCAFFFKRNYPNNEIILKKQDTATNIKANTLKIIGLGNQRFFSSLLYTFTFLEADIEHYKGDPLNNWLFYRFKTILELDERFTEAAHWGGMYLSIIKDDPSAAAIIFDMGLKHYPNHFWLNYLAGYNTYLELHKPKEALTYYLRILGTAEMYQYAALLPSMVADISNDLFKGTDEMRHFEQLLKSVIKDENMPEQIKKRVELKLRK
jgi:hypothetical protein